MVLRSYNVLRKWIFFPISPRDTLESKVKQTLNRCCRGKMFGKKRNQRSWINNNGKQDICDGDCYSTWCLKFRYTLILRSIHDTCDTRVIHAFYVANSFKKKASWYSIHFYDSSTPYISRYLVIILLTLVKLDIFTCGISLSSTLFVVPLLTAECCPPWIEEPSLVLS